MFSIYHIIFLDIADKLAYPQSTQKLGFYVLDREKFCSVRIGSAGVAQLAEQLICNQQVAGSSPIASSMNWRGTRVAKGSRL